MPVDGPSRARPGARSQSAMPACPGAAASAARWLAGSSVLALALASVLGLALPAAAQGTPPAAAAPTSASATVEPPTEVRAIEVTTRPITSFDRAGLSGNKRHGKLDFRGGLVLSSPVKAFGGFSGIAIDPDGRRILLVSDEGGWLSAEITSAGAAPTGLANPRMGPIRGIGGRPLDKKRDLDAEAVTLLEGTLARGTVLVGFERNHRIGRFPVIDGVLQNPVGYLKLPPEAKRMRTNKGFEAVAVMQGGPFKGSVIAFSERFPDNPAQHTGWLWVKGEPARLAFPDIGEFEVTDATSLGDGTLLILERRFRWTEGVKMRIRRFAPGEVKPGALMQGDTLIESDLSSEIDNMEGLAAHRTPGGQIVLTLVSDDNFNHFLQRTLLLQFTLADEGRAAARP